MVRLVTAPWLDGRVTQVKVTRVGKQVKYAIDFDSMTFVVLFAGSKQNVIRSSIAL